MKAVRTADKIVAILQQAGVNKDHPRRLTSIPKRRSR